MALLDSPSSTSRPSRRDFLRLGGLGVAGLALVACGGDRPARHPPRARKARRRASFGELTFQLSWIKNVEFAGEYIADTNGYYKKPGFSKVKLISGGPTCSRTPWSQSGKAFVCISAPDITGVGHQPGRRPDDHRRAVPEEPVLHHIEPGEQRRSTRPQDMIGKKIGVQAPTRRSWNAFLKANNIDPSEDQQGAGAVRPAAAGRPARSTAGSRSSPTSPTC